jgi:hypothetical protein
MFALLFCSFLIRAFVAGFIELGNDEVYYWTYAKFPDWSHFDHPPMVGWVIQVFTLNLHFDHAFFLRLGAVVFGTLNTWLIFLIGRRIKNALTGFYAALLFTASIYCFIIAGTFIMPDTPQVLFWLLSLWLLADCLPDKDLSRSSRIKLILAGVTIGLALLSKYHSVFLILGVFLYMLFYNRKWFRAKETYLAFLVAVVLVVPVIVWNLQNSFVSFTYHESRIGHAGIKIRWDYFGTEILGQVLYNNPVNFILIVLSLVALLRRKSFLDSRYVRLLLLISLPLAVVFIGFSLYSSTLPHWTGPAYLGLILVAAAWLSGSREKEFSQKRVPWPLRIALSLQLILVVAGVLQINYGIIPIRKLGGDDFSAQLYGWQQLGEKFETVAKRDLEQGTMSPSAPIITYRWFPAANLDYYVAGRIDKKVYSLGTLSSIHKYYWIDRQLGELQKGADAYYIGLSNDFADPHQRWGSLFDSIIPSDTIRIFRNGQPVWQAYVFRMKGLTKTIRFDDVHEFVEPSNARVMYWIGQIKANPVWLKMVEEKANKKGVTLDDALWDDASWMVEMEMHK